MNIKWAVDATVRPGTYCSAQGTIKQMSDVGSAMSTLIISLHTLRVLCFWKTSNVDGRKDTEKSEPNVGLNHSLVVVACLWVAVGLLVTVNIAINGVDRFYGPTGYWCWIRAEYSVQRTVNDFAFMWMTTLCNIIIYGILFLNFRGYITTDGWHIRIRRKPERFDVLGPARQAYSLLSYPLVYILSILPLSIARYSSFAHHYVSFAVLCFVDIIYLSLGLLNVLLFSFTRPYLLPHDQPIPDATSESRPSITGISTFPCGRGVSNEVGDALTPESYELPRTDSPFSYCDSACGVSVRQPKSGTSMDEKLGVKSRSLHSLGV